MSKKSLKPKGNSSDEYLGYMRAHENHAGERQSGSHVVVTSTNGRHVTVPDPRKEFPPGTERSIRKQMVAAGFLIVAIAFLTGTAILVATLM
jgi:hypothetical protein